ncbi:hypothetical protein [Alkaliphilus peptidifermentans]|uniref:hypothetical protein n=1 Tax=Alkaliphilus peptidifermentans TaxID=426129 RepID=UPI000B84EF57|nr:hypothetical protein [Alkaliphilus peptidifermentans]
MSLDETKSTDIIKEANELTFVVEKELEDQFPAIEVDYKKGMFNRGFSITLKGSGSSCCG